MDILRRAALHLHRPALSHAGQTFTYEALLRASSRLSRLIQEGSGNGGASPPTPTAPPPRIGLHAAPGLEYVVGTLAIWRSGGIVVPLATSFPPVELAYLFQDAGIRMALTTGEAAERVGAVAHAHGSAVHLMEPGQWGLAAASQQQLGAPAPAAAGAQAQAAGGRDGVAVEPPEAAEGCSSERGALIIYTSGTTGKPKGVLHTHRSLMAQVRSLCRAWEWSAADSILHPLPLHHIHGIVNALYCPLYAGAHVELMPKFSPAAVWGGITKAGSPTSVLMGVPTMYSRLLSAYNAMPADQQAAAAAAAAALRLTVSGSSACPIPTMQRWRRLSGRFLLERYGMTETGMVLSNPYRGPRQPGSVGRPLPNVGVRIAESGELCVRGPTLFSGYWGRPEATAEAFDSDGYFRTGDTAACNTPAAAAAGEWGGDVDADGAAEMGEGGGGGSGEGGGGAECLGYYSILGRTSVDILKSSGYKVSALQVEGVLLEHPRVAEVAVLGVPDQVYGEVITALVFSGNGDTQQQHPQQQQRQRQQQQQQQQQPPPPPQQPAPPPQQHPPPSARAGLRHDLQQHCASRLAPYQCPRRYLVLDAPLPRNAMGKLNKKELLRTYFGEEVEAAAREAASGAAAAG